MKMMTFGGSIILVVTGVVLVLTIFSETGVAASPNGLRIADTPFPTYERTRFRKLEWWFADHGYIDNDEWYTWYDKDEIPEDVTKRNDRVDFLRPNDMCPDAETKSFSLKHCPEPPDCSDVKEKWGKAKLCINRMPFPDDIEQFYIVAMKCIPWWENCDKCMCGILRPRAERDSSPSACIYGGEPGKLPRAPDDDRVDIDSCDPEDLDKIMFNDMVFKADKYKVEPRIIPTSEATSPPTSATTSIPSSSSFPSSVPNVTPSLKPSTMPSYEPSSIPSTSPSNVPSMSVQPSDLLGTSTTDTEAPTYVPSKKKKKKKKKSKSEKSGSRRV